MEKIPTNNKRSFHNLLQGLPLSFVLGLGMLATLAATVSVHRAVRSQDELQFNADISVIQSRIRNRIERYVNALTHARALFQSVPELDRKTFREYIQGLELEKAYPGIQGLGFTKRIAAKDLESHVMEIRRSGFPDYRVWPADPREEYFSIVYLEPFDWRNQRAFGYDMFTEPKRRRAMALARDTGLPTMTEKVVLVQETEADRQPGFLIYVPLYERGASVATVDERRRALRGFIYAPFRAVDLFGRIFGGPPGADHQADIEIFDGSKLEADTLLFDRIAKMDARAAPSGRTLVATMAIKVANHSWTVRVASLPEFGKGASRYSSWAIGLGGLLINFLLWLVLSEARRRADDERRHLAKIESERERLDFFFSRSPTIVLIFSGAERVIELANPAAHHALGKSDLVGKALMDAIPDLANEELIKTLEDAYRTGRTHRSEELLLKVAREPGGPVQLRYLNAVVQATRDESGRVDGVMLLAVDITEQVMVRRQNELILNSAGEGIFGLDRDGRTTFVNPAAVRMLGYESGELLGQRQHERIHHSRLDGSSFDAEECPIYAAIHEGVPHFMDSDAFWKKDGSSFPVEYSSNPIFVNGKVEGAVVVFRDISDRRKVESELRDAVRTRDEFLSIASHELKTPLTPLKLQVQGLIRAIQGSREGQGIPPTLIRLAESSDRQIVRLNRLVENLLDVSRINTGRLQLFPEEADVGSIVSEIVDRYRPEIEAAGCSIRHELPESPLRCRLDLLRIEQVITNLVMNAARHAPRSTITVSVGNAREGVFIEVADDGPGIPQEDLGRIFGRFERAGSSVGGLGLGLFIARQIVDAHGGRIRVESGQGSGTRFIVELPGKL